VLGPRGLGQRFECKQMIKMISAGNVLNLFRKNNAFMRNLHLNRGNWEGVSISLVEIHIKSCLSICTKVHISRLDL
jgi:hypothetical protein